ncbi:DUF3592 domain-containing protein [Streptomyces sp. A5-4]|uniref:DUF3592 domain-containing protein n=1 Tax=Streptomyces sp. A5-4 TaxID=3384771 RepID=UPI003DA96B68
MFTGSGVFGLVLGTLGLLIAAFGIGAFVFMRRKAAEYQQTLRAGLMAEGRCLETHVVHHQSSNGSGNSQRRLIVGFLTYDGRQIRATVAARRPYVAGDLVPLRYLPHRPERAVVDGAPVRLGVASCVVGGMTVMLVGMGLVFALIGFVGVIFASRR